MQKIDDDITNPRQVLVQARLTSLLAQRIFQDGSQEVGDGAEVSGVDADGAEGPTCYVELIAQADVDVADLALGSGATGPHGKGLEELFGGDKQVGDGLFDGGELLLRLGWHC